MPHQKDSSAELALQVDSSTNCASNVSRSSIRPPVDSNLNQINILKPARIMALLIYSPAATAHVTRQYHQVIARSRRGPVQGIRRLVIPILKALSDGHNRHFDPRPGAYNPKVSQGLPAVGRINYIFGRITSEDFNKSPTTDQGLCFGICI